MRRNSITQSGISLIETLVALVVLSIGLLGVAALQLEGLKTGQTALQRTKAILLAADMADRIRSNLQARDAYVADWAGVADPATVCADSAAGVAPGPPGCTAEEMAAFDIWSWKTALAPDSPMGLPAGAGSVQVDVTTVPTTYTVSVRWTEKGQLQLHQLSFQDAPEG